MVGLTPLSIIVYKGTRGPIREWIYELLAYVYFQHGMNPTLTATVLNQFAKEDPVNFRQFEGISPDEVSAIISRLTPEKVDSYPHLHFTKDEVMNRFQVIVSADDVRLPLQFSNYVSSISGRPLSKIRGYVLDPNDTICGSETVRK